MAAHPFELGESEMELKSKIDSIASRGDFVNFVKELRNDLLAHPEEWENDTLERYFEALSAWTDEMDRYYKANRLEVPTSLSWKVLAEMLMASKYFE